jgi:hypothetical protein
VDKTLRRSAPIAAVTMFEDAVLVTEDPRQARQTQSLMRRTWTAAELLQWVSDQLGDDHQQRR